MILLCYDDIAYHKDNPLQGEIYNEPFGDNVYDPDSIDYRGYDVNPDTLMAVLMGDRAGAGGRVLESTENDNVFLFIVDHGSIGVLAFPGRNKRRPISFFFADQLMETFEYMYVLGSATLTNQQNQLNMYDF